MAIPVSRGERGPEGKALVKFNGDKVSITFQDGDNAGYPIILLRDDVPKHLKEGEYFVRLSADSSAIYGLRPSVATTYMFKFLGFIKNDDGTVKIIDVAQRDGTRADGRKWSIPAHQEFLAQVEILSEGTYQGLQMVQSLSYCFSEYNETGLAQLKGTGTKRVQEFLEAAGLDFAVDEIKMNTPPLLLAQLEATLMSRDRYFSGEVSAKGWITKLSPLPIDIVNMMKKQYATAVDKMSDEQLVESMGFSTPPQPTAPVQPSPPQETVSSRFTDIGQVPQPLIMKVVGLGQAKTNEDVLAYLNAHPELTA